jgi:hypothetical protein
MLTGHYEILKRYVNGEYVIPEHLPVLERYCNTGVVKRIGIDLSTGRFTAVLTPLGKRKIEREEIRRSPVKRFFYAWRNNLF